MTWDELNLNLSKRKQRGEQRIAAMRARGWKAETLASTATTVDVEAADADPNELARD